MYSYSNTIKVLLEKEKFKKQSELNQKILNECKNNILINFENPELIVDLNNLGIITFFAIEKLKNNDGHLKWIYYSKESYDELNKFTPQEMLNFLVNLHTNTKDKIVKISFNNKTLEIEKLYNKNFLFFSKKNQVESILFETKQMLKYLNSIFIKIRKINDFVTYTYQKQLFPFPVKQLEHIEEYVEYVESEFNLSQTKKMINCLNKYKIGENPLNLKDIVFEGSLELTSILNQHSNKVIANFNEEIKKIFTI